MKIAIKIIGALMVLCIAIVVAIASILTSMDYGRFKSNLAELVQDATGRELVIAGDVDLAWSLNPTLSVTDVTLANAPWALKADGLSTEPLIKLARLDAKIALRPLLSGRLDISYIVMDGVDIVLQTDGFGKANWEFTPPQAPSEPQEKSLTMQGVDALSQQLVFTPDVRDVRLKNVRVTYKDGASGTQIHTDLSRADFMADGFDSAIHGLVEAVYNTVDVQAEVDLGSLAQLVGEGGAAFPVKAKISAPYLSADIIGMVDQPSAGMALNARLQLKANDSSTLSQLLGMKLPELGAVTVLSSISGSGPSYSFKGIDVQLGNSDFAGNVDVRLDGVRPQVTADLTSSLLDVNALLGIVPAHAEKGPALERLFTTDPLDLSALSIIDADVSLAAKRITVKELALTKTSINAHLKDGSLDVSSLALTLEEGRLLARGKIDQSGETPVVSVHASMRGLDAGKVAAMIGQGRIVTMDLDGEVDVQGTGASTQALAASATGYVNLIGRDGQINDKAFTDLTEGIGSIFPWVSNKDANQISCFVAKWPLDKGNALAQAVMLDTSGVNVRVTGNVDLPGELLHLTVHTKAKKVSLSSFAVPIRVKGPLLNPRIDVSPGEAVVDTVGGVVLAPTKLVAGLLVDALSLFASEETLKAEALKNDPCINALSESKTSPPAVDKGTVKPLPNAKDKPEPKSEPLLSPNSGQDPSKSSGDPQKDLKKVGDALKKLF